MMTLTPEAISALGLWAGFNFALMLALGIHTYRQRAKAHIAVGMGASGSALERAVRAHGNNTEYVPSILFALALCTVLGSSAGFVHISGALLLAARIMHAHGIQQVDKQLPLTRVVGNVITWGLFAGLIIQLIWLSL